VYQHPPPKSFTSRLGLGDDPIQEVVLDGASSVPDLPHSEDHDNCRHRCTEVPGVHNVLEAFDLQTRNFLLCPTLEVPHNIEQILEQLKLM
jgi:hypothetical protein